MAEPIEKPQGFTTVIDAADTRIKQIQEYKNKPISALPQKLVFAGIAVGGVAAVSLIAVHIVTGVLALAFVGVTGVGMWAGYYKVRALAPSMQQKSRNEAMKRMIEEARKNAVYQLDNEVLARKSRLASARKARDDMGGFVERMKSDLLKTDQASANYLRKKDILDRTENAYTLMCQNLDMVGEAVKKFEQQVRDYKDLNEYADMANDAMAIFTSSDDARLQEMLSLESFRQIDADFNSGIVSIENAARDMAIDSKQI